MSGLYPPSASRRHNPDPVYSLLACDSQLGAIASAWHNHAYLEANRPSCCLRETLLYCTILSTPVLYDYMKSQSHGWIGGIHGCLPCNTRRDIIDGQNFQPHRVHPSTDRYRRCACHHLFTDRVLQKKNTLPPSWSKRGRACCCLASRDMPNLYGCCGRIKWALLEVLRHGREIHPGETETVPLYPTVVSDSAT